MSISSSESEPRSPASAVSSLASTDPDSPLSPDCEFSQNFPLSEDQTYQPDETVPASGETARFRGRPNYHSAQNPPPHNPQPPVQEGAQPQLHDSDPAPVQLSENPTPEEIRTLLITGPRRGAGRLLAMADTLPGPSLSPRAQTPE